MSIYTIIAGVNGVGKSSFTGVIKENIDIGVIIDVDKITYEHGKGKIEGAKIALEQIDDCLKKGVSFTQESTLSGYSIKSRIKKAKELGYYIRMFYVGLNSAEESIIRIQNRVMKGKHSIPAEDVLRRFEKRWQSLSVILPYCDEAEFYDNDNGFIKVADFKKGVLQTNEQYIPLWLSELIKYLSEYTEIKVN